MAGGNPRHEGLYERLVDRRRAAAVRVVLDLVRLREQLRQAFLDAPAAVVAPLGRALCLRSDLMLRNHKKESNVRGVVLGSLISLF